MQRSFHYSHSHTLEIEFRILQPPVKGDERNPGVVYIPIQVFIHPIGAVLVDAIDIMITILGGTATGIAAYQYDTKQCQHICPIKLHESPTTHLAYQRDSTCSDGVETQYYSPDRGKIVPHNVNN